MKLATLCLTSCSGCHINLLDLHEALLDLLASNELVYSPVLADMKEPQECDLALVEGAIRNQEDVKRIKALRARAKILVSMGTCAVFGGVAGLGNSHSTDELIEEAYPDTQDREHSPVLLPRVFPIDSVVPIDYYLPGCPPPIEVISDFLADLISGKPPRGNDLPVCAECGRLVTAEKFLKKFGVRIARLSTQQNACCSRGSSAWDQSPVRVVTRRAPRLACRAWAAAAHRSA